MTLTSTRANHNSTRSNRTSSAADIDTNFPDDFDGDELPLESSWVIDFDLVITPVDDPFGSEFGDLGDNVLLQPLAPIDLDLSAPTSVFFDAAAPEFGLLQVSPTGVREWISNPASGHSLHGAGGILVENLAVEASYVGGEPAWERRTRATNQSSGESDFLFGEFDINLSLEGTLNGQPFTISSLTGMVVEEVTFSATFVPEPTAFGLCLATLVGAATRRRR